MHVLVDSIILEVQNLGLLKHSLLLSILLHQNHLIWIYHHLVWLLVLLLRLSHHVSLRITISTISGVLLICNSGHACTLWTLVWSLIKRSLRWWVLILLRLIVLLLRSRHHLMHWIELLHKLSSLWHSLHLHHWWICKLVLLLNRKWHEVLLIEVLSSAVSELI